MVKKSKRIENQTIITPPFYKRFEIDIEVEDAQKRFMNRIFNDVDKFFPELNKESSLFILESLEGEEESVEGEVLRYIASNQGVRYTVGDTFLTYANESFHECLKSIEALYQALGRYEPNRDKQELLEAIIRSAIKKSEIDIGIRWQNGVFWPSGAKLLDEALVNENLKWLSDPKYINVLTPFEKGLRHLVEAQKQPEKLTDIITDMYEALEKMARITNGNNKTLGSNAEQFVNNLGLSDHYDTMLREYTKYAHEFRHAVEQGKERVPPLPNEVEAFIYTTGIFIRLAIQQLG